MAPCMAMVLAELPCGFASRQGLGTQDLLGLEVCWESLPELQHWPLGNQVPGLPPGRECGCLNQEKGLWGRGGCGPLLRNPGQVRGEEGAAHVLPWGAVAGEEKGLLIRAGYSRCKLGMGKESDV